MRLPLRSTHFGATLLPQAPRGVDGAGFLFRIVPEEYNK